ncbi:MAG TPA: hypothetical protein VG916_03650 [Gemmatimonadaceae bacterium]|nr:hypothetical protein [Gemmatimonadaceae bacterium]
MLEGTQSLQLNVSRAQLSTLLAEAGLRSAVVPVSLDGAPVSLDVRRGVRSEYGNCPLPVANTIRAQVNGPPPPTADNGNCVMLAQRPVPTARIPDGLDTTLVAELALELTGMSPNQARDFRRVLGWHAMLAIAPPRFLRSYDTVSVGDAPAMLMISGGRRGPSYTLAWVNGDMVYTLTGYGSPSDAVRLAGSVR